MTARLLRATHAVALLSLALTTACASSGTSTRRRSNVVEYLAAQPADSIVRGRATPRLQLPLRVGIAFVPTHESDRAGGQHPDAFAARDRLVLMERVRDHFAARPWVGSIELIPDAYMTPRGGFEDLDKLRALLGVDVVALLSYDQVQFTDDSRLKITYLTIAGAYLVNGDRNDTRTMLDAAVFDVPSRRMLFRAAGESHVRAGATAVTAEQKRREDARKGLHAAADDLVTKLDAALETFAARVRSPNTDIVVVRPDTTATP